MGIEKEQTISRRGFFHRVGATGVAVVAAGSTLTGMPQNVSAGAVDDAIAKQLGAGTITMGKVNIDTPSKAENGALVRLPVSVDHPMDPDNYIQSIVVYVDNNPKPFVGRFDFEPECGKAAFECRIKMAKTSKLRAIAKTNTGKLYGFEKEVQVAEGGCAG
jgi:sulfur-oxidizing protein SoxY